MHGKFEGSCHCGAVRFACRIDIPSRPGAAWSADDRYAWTYKCNCSFCTKSRYWKMFVPGSAFELLSGKDVLGDYQFGEKMVHHRFCTRCGIAPFASGELEQMGGVFYAINVGCLDNVTPEELTALPVRYEDGRNDEWDHEPAATGYL